MNIFKKKDDSFALNFKLIQQERGTLFALFLVASTLLFVLIVYAVLFLILGLVLDTFFNVAIAPLFHWKAFPYWYLTGILACVCIPLLHARKGNK